ncbi:MAG: LysR family transcriptional regulator [Ramlibacter sp.]|uniref:LysR family transcriptional regulator n=1 Tax=Ramlibacter sp. TaxID=1917967 RepID=UPI00261AA898|nr:LysR family transcriptional regulator [Ramlibacter sp.]MDH4377315.1 LysR family transcriptional regulator [Ramlibacter sp.]
MATLINPARLDFVTLRLFCAVAQMGSVTRGAEACSLAVSAASRRLSDFELAAGTKLFDRSSKGVKLTPAGHLAMQHALRLFQGFEQFSSEIRDYSRGTRGHVRLWANMSALTEFLPACLATFMSEHPDIHVELEEQLSGDIVRAVVDGVADIGIFAENTPVGDLSVEPFVEDQLVAVCAHDHPLGRKKRVSFDECLQYDFVGLNRGSSLLELTSRAAEHYGQVMRVRVQVRSFDAMCQLINANLGIGVLPLAVVRETKPRPLRIVHLKEKWAQRKLLIGVSQTCSSSALLLRSHLRVFAGTSPGPS